MIKYASSIKKTANGRRSRPGRQARRNKKILAQGRFQADGQVDEQETTQRVRQHKAKESANKEAIQVSCASKAEPTLIDLLAPQKQTHERPGLWL
jgi:hypothetical protein